MDTCTKEFIERNIELLDEEKLNIFYDNAENDLLSGKLIPGSIRELTLILKDVYGYEPLEHGSMYAVPAFYRILSDIESFIIPDHIKWIRSSAFMNCGRLTQITIPKSVGQIYDRAFLGCNNLKKINYLGTRKEWDRVVIDYTAFTATGVLANITVYCTDGKIII